MESRHKTDTEAMEDADSKIQESRASDVTSAGCQSVAPRLLNLHDAGKYIGLSYWQVRDYVLSGVLPRIELPSLFTVVKRKGKLFKVDAEKGSTLRRILIDIHDLDALIERSKQR